MTYHWDRWWPLGALMALCDHHPAHSVPDGIADSGVGAGGDIHGFTVYADVVGIPGLYHLYQTPFPTRYS